MTLSPAWTAGLRGLSFKFDREARAGRARHLRHMPRRPRRPVRLRLAHQPVLPQQAQRRANKYKATSFCGSKASTWPSRPSRGRDRLPHRWSDPVSAHSQMLERFARSDSTREPDHRLTDCDSACRAQSRRRKPSRHRLGLDGRVGAFPSQKKKGGLVFRWHAEAPVAGGRVGGRAAGELAVEGVVARDSRAGRDTSRAPRSNLNGSPRSPAVQAGLSAMFAGGATTGPACRRQGRGTAKPRPRHGEASQPPISTCQCAVTVSTDIPACHRTTRRPHP